MKRFVAAAAGCLCLCVLRAPAQAPRRLTVLTYNIQIGMGMDKKTDLARTAAAIRAVSPDIVAVQEVDRQARRTAGVDQAAELARMTGMRMLFGKASEREGSGAAPGDYGIAILTRLPIRSHRNRPLPLTPGFEARTVLEAELAWPEGSREGLRFFATHFDNASREDRAASAKMLVQLAEAQPDTPAVLGGDLNSMPGSEPLQILGAAWQLAGAGRELPTFPAGQPRRQIDYIFYRPANRWRVVEVRVADEPLASDHRPVLAVLELLPAEKVR